MTLRVGGCQITTGRTTVKKNNRANFKCEDVGARLRLNFGDRLALIEKIRTGLRVGIIDDLARLLRL